MTTIALPRPIAPHRSSSPLPSLTHTLSLDNINTSAACPIPIPNKHLPVCPPGPAPSEKPDTPPASPPAKHVTLQQSSLLYPPEKYAKICTKPHVIYSVSAADVAAAVRHLAEQPLPEASQIFPWLHGLHPVNHIQQAFFIARRRALRKTPRCFRGITIVKAGGDLSCGRLKGALAPEEFMHFGLAPEFKEIDPKEGFSVRNFHIQAAKTAMISDIIVYGEDDVEVRDLAADIAAAQHTWRLAHEKSGQELPQYNTFLCTSRFDKFQSDHPEIVATDARGQMTGNVMDFFHQERVEMSTMTKASEIHKNVWLGPTPDAAIDPSILAEDDHPFDIFIECSDLGHLDPEALKNIADGEGISEQQIYMDFPSSGSIMPPSWSLTEADAILESCKWIYYLANGLRPSTAPEPVDAEGDSPMPTASSVTHRPLKFLLHCTDGYTESSMLALAYYIYSTGQTVSQAWLQLHKEKRRNFFAYPSDVALLNAISPRLLSESPALSSRGTRDIAEMIKEEPRWLSQMDGSLPSRVLDYMYLGNLNHANNPDLLRALGIGQILSVGESAAWRDGELQKWGEDKVCVVQGVQDNGVDPLTEEFERCLAFIDKGRQAGTATLVHCRVGVSRSATICIAEVMR